MSSLSLMEWNAKPPAQWDWENLITFGAKTAENSNKLHPAEWVIDGLKGLESGSFYSSEVGNGGSGSGLGSGSGDNPSAKSSKSTSSNSPLMREIKTSQPGESVEKDIPEDSCDWKEFIKVEKNSNHTVEASGSSGEPLLSLRLGKRTYFEDASARSSAKSSSFLASPVPTPAKRYRSSCLNTNRPCCQVEGCNLDLSSAKDYHRKHRVCESHSKCPTVIICGLERRFCQQCSRFHGLSEFDEKKRSCRKRLSNHNARRRKVHQEPVELNSTDLSSSFNDGRQHIGRLWNKVPLSHAKPSATILWGKTGDSGLLQTKGYTVKPLRAENVDGQLNLPGSLSINCNAATDSNGLFLSKGTTAKGLNRGLSTMSANMDAAQDLNRALSLLSNSPGGSYEPKPISLDHIMCANQCIMPQPAFHAGVQGLSADFPDYWQTERSESQASNLASHNYCNGHFQEFEQLRTPYDGAFFSNQFD